MFATRTRGSLLALGLALLVGSACASGPAAEAPEPSATGSAEPVDVAMRLLAEPDRTSPDMRLTLNRAAYVTLALVTNGGDVLLLDARRPLRSKHYEAGMHLRTAREIHSRANRPVRLLPYYRHSRDNFALSNQKYYVVVATAEPVDFRRLAERPCDLEASEPGAAIERLVSCVVEDRPESSWAVSAAGWPVGGAHARLPGRIRH